MWAVLCADVCTDTRVRSWQWRLLRSQQRRWLPSSLRRWKPPLWRRSKSSTWWRDTPQSVCRIFPFLGHRTHDFQFLNIQCCLNHFVSLCPFSYSHWFIWVHNLHIFGVWPVSMKLSRKLLGFLPKTFVKYFYGVLWCVLFFFSAWDGENCLTTSQKKLHWAKKKPGDLQHQHVFCFLQKRIPSIST